MDIKDQPIQYKKNTVRILAKIIAIILAIISVLAPNMQVYYKTDARLPESPRFEKIDFNSPEDYIRKLQDTVVGKNTTVVITVMSGDHEGNHHKYWTDAMSEAMEELGVPMIREAIDENIPLLVVINDDETAIYRNNESILGRDFSVINFDVGERHFVVKSQSEGYLECGIVYIDSVKYSCQANGLNIVSYDNETDSIIDSVGFFTNMEDLNAIRFEKDFINDYIYSERGGI